MGRRLQLDMSSFLEPTYSFSAFSDAGVMAPLVKKQAGSKWANSGVGDEQRMKRATLSRDRYALSPPATPFQVYEKYRVGDRPSLRRFGKFAGDAGASTGKMRRTSSREPRAHGREQAVKVTSPASITLESAFPKTVVGTPGDRKPTLRLMDKGDTLGEVGKRGLRRKFPTETPAAGRVATKQGTPPRSVQPVRRKDKSAPTTAGSPSTSKLSKSGAVTAQTPKRAAPPLSPLQRVGSSPILVHIQESPAIVHPPSPAQSSDVPRRVLPSLDSAVRLANKLDQAAKTVHGTSHKPPLKLPTGREREPLRAPTGGVIKIARTASSSSIWSMGGLAAVGQQGGSEDDDSDRLSPASDERLDLDTLMSSRPPPPLHPSHSRRLVRIATTPSTQAFATPGSDVGGWKTEPPGSRGPDVGGPESSLLPDSTSPATKFGGSGESSPNGAGDGQAAVDGRASDRSPNGTSQRTKHDSDADDTDPQEDQPVHDGEIARAEAGEDTTVPEHGDLAVVPEASAAAEFSARSEGATPPTEDMPQDVAGGESLHESSQAGDAPLVASSPPGSSDLPVTPALKEESAARAAKPADVPQAEEGTAGLDGQNLGSSPSVQPPQRESPADPTLSGEVDTLDGWKGSDVNVEDVPATVAPADAPSPSPISADDMRDQSPSEPAAGKDTADSVAASIVDHLQESAGDDDSMMVQRPRVQRLMSDKDIADELHIETSDVEDIVGSDFEGGVPDVRRPSVTGFVSRRRRSDALEPGEAPITLVRTAEYHWHAAHRHAGIVAREEVFQKLEEAVDKLVERPIRGHPPIVLVGEGGSGKSAIASTFATRSFLGRTDDRYTFLHIVGAHALSTDLRELLLRICVEVSLAFHVSAPAEFRPENFQRVKAEFARVLKVASHEALKRSKTIIIVVDGVNMLHDSFGAWDMDWVPLELPAGVAFLVTTTAASPCFKAMKKRVTTPPTIIDVPGLSSEAQHEVIRRGLGITLASDALLDALCTKRSAEQPMYLHFCAELIRRQANLGEEAESLLDHAKTLPDNISGVVERLLEAVEEELDEWAASQHTVYKLKRLGLGVDHFRDADVGKQHDTEHGDADIHGNHFGAVMCRNAFAVLSCIHRGIEQTEMMELLAPVGSPLVPLDAWEILSRAITELGDRQGTGSTSMLTCSKAEVLQAVRHRYFEEVRFRHSSRVSSAGSAAGDRKIERLFVSDVYGALESFFAKSADPHHDHSWKGEAERAFHELIFSQVNGLRLTGLKHTLGSLAFITAIAKQGAVSMQRLLNSYHHAIHAVEDAKWLDLKPEVVALRSSRDEQIAWLGDFAAFVASNHDTLVQSPHLSFQLARNQPNASAACAAAEVQLQKHVHQLVEYIGPKVAQRQPSGRDSVTSSESDDELTASLAGHHERELLSGLGKARVVGRAPRWSFAWENKARTNHLLADHAALGRNITALAVSQATPDVVALGLEDGTAVTMVIQSGEILQTFGEVLSDDEGSAPAPHAVKSTPHTGRVSCIALSNDGKVLVSGGHDGVLYVRNAKSAATIACLEAHIRPITCLDFMIEPSRRRRRAAKVREPSSAVKDDRSLVGEKTSIDFGKRVVDNGRRFVSASLDRSMRVWAEATEVYDKKGNMRPTFTTIWHLDFIRSPILALDHCMLVPLLAIGRADGVVQLWDTTLAGTEGISCVEQFDAHPYSSVSAVAISDDGNILATGGLDSAVRVWRYSFGVWEEQRMVGAAHAAGICDIDFSDDARRLVSCALDHHVLVWDTESMAPLLYLTGHSGEIYGVAFVHGKDSSRVISCGHDATVKYWNAEVFRPTAGSGGVSPAAEQTRVAKSEKTRRIVTRRSSVVWRSAINVVRRAHVKESRAPKGMHTDRVTVALARGDVGLTGCADREIKVWDLRTGVAQFVLLGHDAGITAMCFNQAGSLIASGDESGHVILWDAKLYKHIGTLKAFASGTAVRAVVLTHAKQATAAAASDSSKGDEVIVVGDDTGVIRVFEVESLTPWKHQPDPVESSVMAMHVAEPSESSAPSTSLPVAIDGRGGWKPREDHLADHIGPTRTVVGRAPAYKTRRLLVLTSMGSQAVFDLNYALSVVYEDAEPMLAGQLVQAKYAADTARIAVAKYPPTVTAPTTAEALLSSGDLTALAVCPTIPLMKEAVSVPLVEKQVPSKAVNVDVRALGRVGPRPDLASLPEFSSAGVDAHLNDGVIEAMMASRIQRVMRGKWGRVKAEVHRATVIKERQQAAAEQEARRAREAKLLRRLDAGHRERVMAHLLAFGELNGKPRPMSANARLARDRLRYRFKHATAFSGVRTNFRPSSASTGSHFRHPVPPREDGGEHMDTPWYEPAPYNGLSLEWGPAADDGTTHKSHAWLTRELAVAGKARTRRLRAGKGRSAKDAARIAARRRSTPARNPATLRRMRKAQPEVAVQSAWRGRQARKQRAKQDKAAKRVQAAARGRQGRMKAKRKRRHKAAVKIQSVGRGYLTRRSVNERRARQTWGEQEKSSEVVCTAVAFAPDGTVIAAGGDSYISVFSAARPAMGPVAEFPVSSEITAVAVGSGLSPESWPSDERTVHGPTAEIDEEEAGGTAEHDLPGRGDGSIVRLIAGDADGNVFILRLTDSIREAESKAQAIEAAEEARRRRRGARLRPTKRIKDADAVEIETRSITFPNGNEAVAVLAPAPLNPQRSIDVAVARRLLLASGIKLAPTVVPLAHLDADDPGPDERGDTCFVEPRAVVCCFGGAAGLHALLVPGLSHMLGHGVMGAAAQTGAMIVNGGTDAGVIQMVGKAVNLYPPGTIRCFGTCPLALIKYPGMEVDPQDEGNLVDLEPNHHSFCLAQGSEWGGETPTLFTCLAALRKHIPIAAVIANGGAITKLEVLHAVKQGIPLVVVEGSGRLANQIARHLRDRDADGDDWDSMAISDETMRYIIDCGKWRIQSVTDQPKHLTASLVGMLELEHAAVAATRETA